TILENFPLFCPKCKHETVISVKYQKILTLKEPGPLTQSR
ncbi:MAG: conjugal transfer protein, partial [Hungatella sp.]|nr:conjugal transfer protein [Hungatella sp.]